MDKLVYIEEDGKAFLDKNKKVALPEGEYHMYINSCSSGACVVNRNKRGITFRNSNVIGYYVDDLINLIKKYEITSLYFIVEDNVHFSQLDSGENDSTTVQITKEEYDILSHEEITKSAVEQLDNGKYVIVLDEINLPEIPYVHEEDSFNIVSSSNGYFKTKKGESFYRVDEIIIEDFKCDILSIMMGDILNEVYEIDSEDLDILYSMEENAKIDIRHKKNKICTFIIESSESMMLVINYSVGNLCYSYSKTFNTVKQLYSIVDEITAELDSQNLINLFEDLYDGIFLLYEYLENI